MRLRGRVTLGPATVHSMHSMQQTLHCLAVGPSQSCLAVAMFMWSSCENSEAAPAAGWHDGISADALAHALHA